MKKIFSISFVVFAFLSISLRLNAETISFPGAEGWGKFSKGGRGGKVIEVTNLNDDGPGSFRAAVMNKDPRTVVFRVSGTIELKSKLIITSPYLTIAGQTAPGDGICLKNYPLDITNTHDILVRYLRIRPGAGSGLIGSEIDGTEVRESSNIIYDHCSVSWSCDEGINNWHKSSFVTFQWCLMSDPLNKSVHEKGAHGFSSTIGGYKATFHHNILANGTARNPSIGGNNQNPTVMLDVRNCIISNWQHRSTDGKPLSINLVNNYYKPGPATQDRVKRRIASIDNAIKYGFSTLWYIEGNFVEGYPSISANNWAGGVDFDEGTSEARNRQTTPFEFAPVTTQSAVEAYNLVLKNAGATYPKRDSQDERVIAQIKTGVYSKTPTGIIDNVEQVGGWPQLKSAPAPVDGDHDGMPDSWEKAHGLNPNDAADGSKITGGEGYTNLEVYLNSIVPDPYK
jgi:pectate lyase